VVYGWHIRHIFCRFIFVQTMYAWSQLLCYTNDPLAPSNRPNR
jgi:hypothetical protein